MTTAIKAFEGEPATTLTHENGRAVITVTMRHLRPDDAAGADMMGTVLACGAVGLAGWIAYEMMEITAASIALFVGGIVGRPLLQPRLRAMGRVTAAVKFTEERIFFQKAPDLIAASPWREFDRRHPHRFVLVEHDNAQAEKDRIEYDQRNNPGRRVARYYTTSWFVVLEYMGQRYDLAEVMGQREATAILDRLNLCDQYMNGVVSARQRLPMRAEDEWPGSTGSIPR